MSDDPPTFPHVDVEFFRSFGVKPCDATYEKWGQFLREHPKVQHRSKYVRCLALCADVADALVENWLSKQELLYLRIAREHVTIFQTATVALGLKLPRSLAEDRRTEDRSNRRGPTRVALFTSLSVVSEPYHMSVISSIVRSAAATNVLLSVHELAWSHPLSGDAVKAAGQIVTRFAPDAVLTLRLTPSRQFLQEMVFDTRPLPIVLIHADRQNYPPPVLANVVPDHRFIVPELAGWLRRRSHILGRKRPKVVLASMAREEEYNNFPKLNGIQRSIRNDRIEAVERALHGFNVVRFDVPDYSFRHALKILRKQPKADAYVCLSDQLAVGLKQLMLGKGGHGWDWRNRIVGFDGSLLASEEKVPSLAQGLDEIGQRALGYLCKFLAKNESRKAAFPERADEISIPVHLANAD